LGAVEKQQRVSEAKMNRNQTTHKKEGRKGKKKEKKKNERVAGFNGRSTNHARPRRTDRGRLGDIQNLRRGETRPN